MSSRQVKLEYSGEVEAKSLLLPFPIWQAAVETARVRVGNGLFPLEAAQFASKLREAIASEEMPVTHAHFRVRPFDTAIAKRQALKSEAGQRSVKRLLRFLESGKTVHISTDE